MLNARGKPVCRPGRRLLLCLALFASVLGACAGPEAPSASAGPTVAEIQVLEHDFKITMDQQVAPPGQIVFHIKNMGPHQHEFVIFKTDLAVDNLPLNERGDRIAEEGAGITHITEQAQFPAGETRVLTATLESGRYVCVCNLPGHYLRGMRVELTVTDNAGPTLTAIAMTPTATPTLTPTPEPTPTVTPTNTPIVGGN